MPTYAYRCEACSHEFDHFQSITAASLRTCPSCGKRKLKRLIGTGAGIIFRGSGFYETDYRSESYKQAAKADTQPAAPAAKSDSASTSTPSTTAKSESAPQAGDSKPAASSAAKSGAGKKSASNKGK